MPIEPIYEKEPLPGEAGAKSGVPHSSYELARLRTNREAAAEPPEEALDYKPATPRGEMQEAKAQEARRALIPAIEGSVRRQILNAKTPGLGNMQGPLQEPVQRAVEKAARPLVRQVVPYSVDQIRKGKSEPVATPQNAPAVKPPSVDENPTHVFETKAVSGIGLVSKRVPNPNYVPPQTSAEDVRAAEKSVELKKVRNVITSKFHELASSTPEAHPDDVRLSTESWARRTLGRGSLEGHDDHLTTLTRGLDSQEARHPAMRERAKQMDNQGTTKEERSSSADVVDLSTAAKAPRKNTDRAVMSVMRKLATDHWRASPAGKLAGTVKNEITGELHPGAKNSPAYKNPKNYMQKKMGIQDPAYHIESNYADEVRSHSEADGGDALPPLTPGGGTKPQPPTAPTSTFATDYLKNRLGAFSAGSGEGKK